MWSILKIYMGLGLLAIYVHGYDQNTILNAWNKSSLIDGIFRLFERTEFLRGAYADFYIGANGFDKNFVALKISSKNKYASYEYEIYGYLNAIRKDDEPHVEQYGISVVYYFNQHKVGSLTALSLFECDLFQKKIEPQIEFLTKDYLILFRHFVRQTKYVHSCGIVHGNVNPHNIMLRKGRSFLTDFSQSSKMNKICPLADWKQFIFTMAMIVSDDGYWLQVISDKHNDRRSKKPFKLDVDVHYYKSFIDETITKINCVDLKAVMIAFYQEAYKNEIPFPNYDYLDGFITQKIGDDEQSAPVIFSWLENDEAAKEDLQNNRPKTAKEIPNPVAKSNRDYTKPNSEYFNQQKRKVMANEATQNFNDTVFHEEYIKKKNELYEAYERTPSLIPVSHLQALVSDIY